MKKFYRIIALLIALIFLTTYSPGGFNVFPKKKNLFFKIQNIEVVNNYIIKKNEITEKLTQIYEKNILFVDRKDIERPLKSIDFLEKITVSSRPRTARLSGWAGLVTHQNFAGLG